MHKHSYESDGTLLKRLQGKSKKKRAEAAIVLAWRGVVFHQRVLPFLIDLLQESDKNLRWEAGKALARVGGAAVPALCDVLRGNSGKAWLAAVRALGDLGERAEPAVGQLCEGLGRHELEDVEIARALGRIGPKAKEATDKLCRRMQETHSSSLRWAIVFALGQLGDCGPQVAEALRLALTDPDAAVRSGAVEALARLNIEGVEAWLAPMLEDMDSQVRVAAVQALQTTKQAEQLETLCALIRDPESSVRRALAHALGELPWSHKSVETLLRLALHDGNNGVCARACESLQQAETRWLPAIFARLRRESRASAYTVRAHVAQVLGAFGRRAKDELPVLQNMLRDPRFEVRNSAITAIGSLREDAASAVPVLRDMLLESFQRNTFEFAQSGQLLIDALGQIGDAAEEAAPVLFSLLQRQDDISLRFRLLKALEQMSLHGMSIVPVLSRLWDDVQKQTQPHHHEHQLEEIAQVLTRFGAQSVPMFCRILRKGTQPQRLIALRALERLGPHAEGALEALLDLSQGDEEEMPIRVAVLGVLAQLGDCSPAVLTRLREGLHDDSQEIQSAAALAWGTLGQIRELKPLKALLDDAQIPLGGRLGAALSSGVFDDGELVSFAADCLERAIARDREAGREVVKGLHAAILHRRAWMEGVEDPDSFETFREHLAHQISRLSQRHRYRYDMGAKEVDATLQTATIAQALIANLDKDGAKEMALAVSAQACKAAQAFSVVLQLHQSDETLAQAAAIEQNKQIQQLQTLLQKRQERKQTIDSWQHSFEDALFASA